SVGPAKLNIKHNNFLKAGLEPRKGSGNDSQKNMKKNLLILFLIILVLVAGFLWYFFYLKPLQNNSANNLPEPEGEISILGNPQLDKAVTDYLLSQEYFSWKTADNSRNFCVFANLNPESDLFPLYLWVRCGEFAVENGELKELSGTSLPIKIDYPNELSYYDISKFLYTAPRDGTFNGSDIEKIFPENVRQYMSSMDKEFLNEKIKDVAKESFGL
ncbi:MAG: hypothetical protein PHG23_02960, partial [Candidatus Pacebacteria bacterium]|nr:hypothetical protein [Candidatus Paceibacterota bacterium]